MFGTAPIAIDMRTSNRSRVMPLAILFVIAAGLFLPPLTGCQQNPPRQHSVLVMQRSVSFPEIELVDRQIREDCGITTRLPDDIEYYAKPYFSRIDRVDSVSTSTPGKALIVKIIGFKGNGRSMVVEGVLWERGVVIGNFVTQDTFWRSTSSCMALAGISRTLGKRIGKWLAAPTPNARLGPVR